MENLIEIHEGDHQLALAQAVILVPNFAAELNEKTVVMVAGSDAQAKHAVHALAEMALLDFEDEELEMETLSEGSTVVAKFKDCEEFMGVGIVIARDEEGKTRLFGHEEADVYRLLKFAHRYCTRWVRLDI